MRSFGLWMVVTLGCGSVTSSDDPIDSGTGTQADAAQLPDGSSSTDAAAPDAGIVPNTCEPSPSCGEAGRVAATADVVAIADGCPTWGQAEVDSARNRTPTFLATQDLAVCPDDFTLPADCAQGDPLCRAAILITVDENLTGVDPTVACGGAQFAAGSRFRVRFTIDRPTFGNELRTAHVHFERACGADCIAGEHRCEANANCYPDGEVCFACARGTREECACRTPDNGVLADCTECQVRFDDFIVIGQCVSGICEGDPCDTCPCT